MPQYLLNDLHVNLRRERQRGCAVPEVVEPDRRQAGFLTEALEDPRHHRGVQRRAVLAHKHQAGVDPCVAPGRPLFALPLAVRSQHLDRAVIQRDHALTRIGLGASPLDLPAELDKLLTNRHRR